MYGQEPNEEWSQGSGDIGRVTAHLGGGCDTAMACTFRIATLNARFGQPKVKLGPDQRADRCSRGPIASG